MSVFSEAKMTVGTSAYNLVQLDGSARLPAVNGSLLTNVNGAKVAQVVSSISGSVQTGTTTVPYDDTIPQNTEGTQFYSLSITPTNASSSLLVSIMLNYAISGSDAIIWGLFVDSTSDAIAAGTDLWISSSTPQPISSSFIIPADSTSTRTYKLRAGKATAGTVTINGYLGSRKLGGVLVSGIIITEILP